MPQPHPPVSGHGEALPFRVEVGEPRALDVDLARRLGFSQPRDIRKLIKRLRGELERFGALAEVDLDRYGRPVSGSTRCGNSPDEVPHHGEPDDPDAFRGFLLTYEQAFIVAIASDAPRAPDVRHEVVTGYMAWQRERAGLAASVQNPEPAGVDLLDEMGDADRMADTDLAAFLGSPDPFGLRLLIERHGEELRERGELRRYSLNRGTRGRPRVAFLLNRAQCLFLDGVFVPAAAPPMPSPQVNVVAPSIARRPVFHRPAAFDGAGFEPASPARRTAAADPVAEALALLTAKMLRQDEEIAALKARPALPAPVRPAQAARLAPSEADALDLFITGCTVENRSAKVRASDLFVAWSEFCRLADITPGSVGWFGSQMKGRGFRWIKSSVVYYLGFDLLPSPSWSDGGLFDQDGGAA